jgi:hypothetical protein
MFAYASALVELGYFDAIDMNFLIVGHTHSSIDQYFSVLSKAIKSAEFIGSPISLQALCSQAHKDRARPSVNRMLQHRGCTEAIHKQEDQVFSSSSLLQLSPPWKQMHYVLQALFFSRKMVTS